MFVLLRELRAAACTRTYSYFLTHEFQQQHVASGIAGTWKVDKLYDFLHAAYAVLPNYCCLAVGVQPADGTAYDAPIDNTDWPNVALQGIPSLKFWLK